MVEGVVEHGLDADLISHVGYEVGGPAGRGSPNSGNKSTPKTVARACASSSWFAAAHLAVRAPLRHTETAPSRPTALSTVPINT